MQLIVQSLATLCAFAEVDPWLGCVARLLPGACPPGSTVRVRGRRACAGPGIAASEGIFFYMENVSSGGGDHFLAHVSFLIGTCGKFGFLA